MVRTLGPSARGLVDVGSTHVVVTFILFFILFFCIESFLIFSKKFETKVILIDKSINVKERISRLN